MAALCSWEGQQYLLLALDQGEGDALPLLGVVIPGQLLDGLCHVCNRTTQFPCETPGTRLKSASFPWGLGHCFCLLFSRPGKRRHYLGSAPVLSGTGFPLPFPKFPATQVSMESSWLGPISWPCTGDIPNSATLVLLGSGVSTRRKLGWRLKEIVLWE